MDPEHWKKLMKITERYYQMTMSIFIFNASVQARTSLHGCDIYNNCCTMKVEYSKLETLHVRENGPMSWDFVGGTEEPGKRKSILETPDGPGMMMGGGGGNSFPPNAPKMNMGGPPGMGMSNMGGGGGQGMGQPGGGFGMGGGYGSGGMGGALGAAMSLMGGAMGGGGPAGGGGGYGGYGGGSGGAHDMMGGYGDMGGNYGGGGGDGKSCVLMCYGLEPPKWNCERLFNLLCQGGTTNL
jgi:hypothetical protein